MSKKPLKEGYIPYNRSYGHMLGIFNETGDALVRSESSSTCWKANYDFKRDDFRKIGLDDARKNHFPTVFNLEN